MIPIRAQSLRSLPYSSAKWAIRVPSAYKQHKSISLCDGARDVCGAPEEWESLLEVNDGESGAGAVYVGQERG